jgi:NADPH2:quinone reductase
MKVGLYREKGDARSVLRIEEIALPEMGDDDVLIRLHASGINPSDVKMRAGQSLGGMAMPYPEVIPHSDGAGVIEAVGNRVEGFTPGDRVYVFNAGFKRAFGTAAETIVISSEQARHLPDGVSFAHGACLGIPAMTAVHAVTRAPCVEGKQVFISGGGGVVGRYAIQVAKALGAAQIITTASSYLSRKTALEAGANHVLDYRQSNLTEAVLDLSGGIDHAIEAEFGVNAAMLGQVMNINGSVAAYGSAIDRTPTLPFYDFMFKNITVHMLLVYLLDKQTRNAATDLMADLLKAGSITENIASTFPLNQIVDAHEMVEASSKSGSVLLSFS